MTPATPLRTEIVGIPTLDGATMPGYVAAPEQPAPRAGIVVGPELFGLTTHVREVCEHFAALGYLAVAPCLHHRSSDDIELPEDEQGRTRGFELLHQLARRQTVDDVQATLNFLTRRSAPAAGMVGLSVGGHVAYLAAAHLDLPAVAALYPGWLTSTAIPLSQPRPTIELTSAITARVLLLVGDHDHLVPESDREQLRSALTDAHVKHEITIYPDTAHGFLNPHRASYAPDAAAHAWKQIRHFLLDTNKPH